MAKSPSAKGRKIGRNDKKCAHYAATYRRHTNKLRRLKQRIENLRQADIRRTNNLPFAGFGLAAHRVELVERLWAQRLEREAKQIAHR